MKVDAGPGLVGRERELTALRSALAAGPAVVVVEGEAGVGKTRLVQAALAALASGGRVLTAACPPLREPFTLGPIVDALRMEAPRVAGQPLSPLAGALRPLFPDWADDLPATPEPLDDVRAARHRLFRALLEVLRGLETVALVVEDGHWADEATIEFLLFLATQPALPVSVVVTYRPEDVPAESLLRQLSGRYARVRCVLEPLSPAATAELVSSVLDGDRVSADFAAFLHQHTAGLPLEVEELVRLMRERADLVRFGEEWRRRRLSRIAVPATVRDTVLERTGRRSAAARRLLYAAAVLDAPSPAAEILAVADVPAGRADRALAECLRSGLMQEDPRDGWPAGTRWRPGRSMSRSRPPRGRCCTGGLPGSWNAWTRYHWPGWPTTSGRRERSTSGVTMRSGRPTTRWRRRMTRPPRPCSTAWWWRPCRPRP